MVFLAADLWLEGRRMKEGGKEAIRADDEVVAKAEILALQKQTRELQRVLGKKTPENEILREAVKRAAKSPRPFVYRRSPEPSIRGRPQMFGEIHSCAGPFWGPRNKHQDIFTPQSDVYSPNAVAIRPTFIL